MPFSPEEAARFAVGGHYVLQAFSGLHCTSPSPQPQPATDHAP